MTSPSLTDCDERTNTTPPNLALHPAAGMWPEPAAGERER
jgi:hypothetical protein